MNLTEIRSEIDSLDRQITELLCQRMDIARQVAACKKEQGLPVYHPQREQQVIDKAKALAGEDFGEAVETIYHCIMDERKKVQEAWLQKNTDSQK